jgi:general L-amino acid transport system permease protein
MRPRRRERRPLGWRAWAWQLAAAFALAALVLWLGRNAALNMEQRNITFGFGFLAQRAGFDIPFHMLPWSADDTYGWALVVCIVNSLVCAGMAVVTASLLGLLLALMRLSGNPLAAGIARSFVELVRNTPLLAQIFFIYVAVLQSLPPPRNSINFGASIFLNVRGLLVPAPLIGEGVAILGVLIALLAAAGWFARNHLSRATVLAGFALLLLWVIGAGVSASWERPALKGFNFVGGLRLPPELLALWLGISIYTSAFISEIMRAAILGIPHGQTEAALSAGLTRGQTMYLVIFPQALRTMIPPLTSQYLNIIKSTTLGAAIAYPDVLQIFGRTVLNQSGRAIEVMTLLIGVFLVINLGTSAVLNRWNSRLISEGR